MKVSDWSQSDESGANAAKTLTQAAVSGQRRVICGYQVVVRGAAPAPSLDIAVILKSGTTVIWQDAIGGGAGLGDKVAFAFPVPLAADVGAQITMEAAAGGAGVVTQLSWYGYTE